MKIGVTFPPDQPPERLREVAMAAEAAGLDELWLWEDCFAESGMAPAAAVLGWTERLQVGVGLFPVPLRNVALTAMEIATLARLFPGRLLPGVGHGVLDWMGQVGARVDSPMTLLREYTVALRRLLDGEKVTVSGRYVTLTDVQLRWPPPPVPLYVGAVGPKTIALAGELSDGVILTPDTRDIAAAIEIARQARGGAGTSGASRDGAGQDGAPEAIVFASVPVTASVAQVREHVEQLRAAGASRVAICGLSPEGPPDGTERVFELVQTVAQVRAEVGG